MRSRLDLLDAGLDEARVDSLDVREVHGCLPKNFGWDFFREKNNRQDRVGGKTASAPVP